MELNRATDTKITDYCEVVFFNIFLDIIHMMENLGISGSRFNRAIDFNDLLTLGGAEDRDHIGTLRQRIWDRIADWFCGANVTEAKKLLHDLLNIEYELTSRTAVFERTNETFARLGALCAGAHKGRFYFTIPEIGKNPAQASDQESDQAILDDIDKYPTYTIENFCHVCVKDDPDKIFPHIIGKNGGLDYMIGPGYRSMMSFQNSGFSRNAS